MANNSWTNLFNTIFVVLFLFELRVGPQGAALHHLGSSVGSHVTHLLQHLRAKQIVCIPEIKRLNKLVSTNIFFPDYYQKKLSRFPKSCWDFFVILRYKALNTVNPLKTFLKTKIYLRRWLEWFTVNSFFETDFFLGEKWFLNLRNLEVRILIHVFLYLFLQSIKELITVGYRRVKGYVFTKIDIFTTNESMSMYKWETTQ